MRTWIALVLMSAGGSAAAAPRIFYTDLISGPNTGGQDDNGVFVTLSGAGFEPTRGASVVMVGGGEVASYLAWSDSSVTVQLGAAAASGAIVLTTAAGSATAPEPFTVRSGRIFFVAPSGVGDGSFAAPMSPSAAYGIIQPGDTFYFRGGVYDQRFGDTMWSDCNFCLGPSKSGSVGNPVALVGYPGEAPELRSAGGNVNLRDSTNAPAGEVVIANFVMIGGGDCVNGGAVTIAGAESEKSGAPGLRLVNNDFSATYDINTMTGLVTVGNDGARIYGNEFHDTGTTPPINNNHALYIHVGASDVDVAWNYFHDLRLGHVIQVHTDTYFLFTDVRIHDNVLSAADPDDSRGISAGNVLPGTTGAIYNNVLYNLGQDFSAIVLYDGHWKVFNNTLYGIRSSTGMVWLGGQWGGNPSAEISNNIFVSDGSSPYFSLVGGLPESNAALASNLYFNAGAPPPRDATAISADPLFVDAAAGDFHLQRGSPAIDSGSVAVAGTVATDRDGYTRPQGAGFDIGAYEVAIVCQDAGDCSTPPPCGVAAGATCDGGACLYPAGPDGAPCDDGDLCSSPDSCLGGACAAGPNICSPCGDADGDGYDDAACGGDDCNDGDASVRPGTGCESNHPSAASCDCSAALGPPAALLLAVAATLRRRARSGWGRDRESGCAARPRKRCRGRR